jgi:predicted DNA-binding protein YlxM (UPF0122 family)
MFYQRFGLGGEEPKSALEISRSHNVSKQAVHDAINSIMEELTRKMRAA